MIAVAGINYQSAGFEVLSRISAAKRQAGLRSDAISGMVWVQTCNRLEIYADLNLHCRKAAEKLLLQQLGPDLPKKITYLHFEDDAVLHLFKVAAGLDSAIVGEDQVLHQLKLAFKQSACQHLNTPLLNKLFHKAFATGKNVRTHTNLNKGNISAASIAAELLQSFRQEYPALKGTPVLIIGAGETGALVTEILVKKGFTQIMVWNRTAAKAKKLANEFGVTAIAVKSLADCYSKSSMVVVAIQKQTPALDFSINGQPGVKRILIDLSMPLQVQEAANSADSFVYNLEGITAIRTSNTAKRKEAIDDALQLVWASFHEFKAWKEQEWVGQTLQQWKVLLTQIQERQLKSFTRQHPDADQETLSLFARDLSAQMLKQLAWTIRQQEKEGSEGQQWSRLLSSVEPYEQLN